VNQIILLAPTHPGVGLISVSMGFVRALESQGVNTLLFSPIQFYDASASDNISGKVINSDISFEDAETLVSEGNSDILLENITEQFEAIKNTANTIVIKGVLHRNNKTLAAQLNAQIARSLGASVIIVTNSISKSSKEINELIELTAIPYGGIKNSRLIGTIINQVEGPKAIQNTNILFEAEHENIIDFSFNNFSKQAYKNLTVLSKQFQLIGAIPWDRKLSAPRVIDVIKVIGADIIAEGQIKSQRIFRISIFARTVNNLLSSMTPGTLIVSAGDRIDILMAVCLAVTSGKTIPAIILTGGYELSDTVKEFCAAAIRCGLTILSVPTDTFHTAIMLQNIKIPPPSDDSDRIEYTKDFIARYIDKEWIKQQAAKVYEKQLSPPAFRFQIIEKAKKAKKTIVLPEGNEPRTIAAANVCVTRGIANCILLGDIEEIKVIAKNNSINLHPNIEIRDPSSIIEEYVEPMLKIRAHKGLTEIMAREQLKNNIILGTMMLSVGDVDGLVSGAVHTTADTIRPAFQLIKPAPSVKLVSSIFFMCMPEQVLIFGDCAVNPEPDAESLADIAIQSAESAKIFGIEPKIAMISYSTGTSGSGTEVEKVAQATNIVKKLRPDLLIDGPLQYDSAIIPQVANKKAPTSPVAGKATVIIFPDLNTGNTTYKAVQRSADILCIGPMLQGLNKPVNDLSRGATIDDIIYTIAITAVQSTI
tara:strand:- start:15723 stop:17837 length:2115 start_codon:yes stop_codon:yes gene_type:complete